MKTVVVFSTKDKYEAREFSTHPNWGDLKKVGFLIVHGNDGDRLVFLLDKQYGDEEISRKLLENIKKPQSEVYFIFHTPENKVSQGNLVSSLGDIIAESNYSHQSGNIIYSQIVRVMKEDSFDQEFNKLCSMIGFPAIYESASQILMQLFLFSLEGEINDNKWETLQQYLNEFLDRVNDKLPENNKGVGDLLAVIPENNSSDQTPNCLLADATKVINTIMLDIESTN